jgi:translocation and assembly module TamB
MDFVYQKNLLDVRESVFKASGEEHRIKGRISFPEAKELFELSVPVYNLTANIRNAEFGQAVRIFYKDFDAKGRLNGDIKIAGKDKDIDISGNVSVEKASVYNMPFDSGSAVIAYLKREFSLRKVKIARGKSVLTGEGRLSADGKFSYSASSDSFYLKDFVPDRITVPVDAVLMGQSQGRGTFDDPLITVNARFVGGTFKGRNMGGGTISAKIQNRDISVEAAMFNDKMKLKGRGYLDEKLPWNAELSIQPGRYDFIVSSFLKDVPEDLQLNLEGRVEMKGDRKNITASANITHLALLLFGQNFSNDSPINFSVNNKKISLKVLRIKSGSTSFRVQGGLEIGREFDVELDGSSSLSPLKGLSKKIGYLKGEADFVLSVSGKWDRPEINGGMNISNASFGLRDYATYLSSMNVFLFVDG